MEIEKKVEIPFKDIKWTLCYKFLCNGIHGAIDFYFIENQNEGLRVLTRILQRIIERKCDGQDSLVWIDGELPVAYVTAKESNHNKIISTYRVSQFYADGRITKIMESKNLFEKEVAMKIAI